MIIYPDLISHDEMFSDIYKIRRLQTSCAWRWKGRWSGGLRVTLVIASTEGPEAEGMEHSNHWCRYGHEPAFAGNQLHKRNLQKVY